MFEKNTLLRGALILIISLAVLQFLAPAVEIIDTTGMPSWEIQAVVIIQHFFEVTPIALLAGFAWSLFGFLRYNFGDSTIQYEVDKMYQTLMWFEGLMILMAAGLPIELSLSISTIIMAVKSVINALRAAATTTATASAPGPPSPS